MPFCQKYTPPHCFYANLAASIESLYYPFLFSYALVRCKHKKCYYYDWSSWSATCGDVTRSRKRYYQKDDVTYVKETKDCDAYPKTCELYEKENKKMDKCPSKFSNYEIFLESIENLETDFSVPSVRFH